MATEPAAATTAADTEALAAALMRRKFRLRGQDLLWRVDHGSDATELMRGVRDIMIRAQDQGLVNARVSVPAQIEVRYVIKCLVRCDTEDVVVHALAGLRVHSDYSISALNEENSYIDLAAVLAAAVPAVLFEYGDKPAHVQGRARVLALLEQALKFLESWAPPAEAVARFELDMELGKQLRAAFEADLSVLAGNGTGRCRAISL